MILADHGGADVNHGVAEFLQTRLLRSFRDLKALVNRG